MIETSKKFTLPEGSGFTTDLGTKITGEMRLAKVKDFIDIQRDARIKTNPGFMYLSLLGRVITKLGTEKAINNGTIGKLSPIDFGFLVDFFNDMNHGVLKYIPVKCECGKSFMQEMKLPGEASAVNLVV